MKPRRAVEQLRRCQSCSRARMLSSQYPFTTRANLAHLLTPLLRPADIFLRPRLILPALPGLPRACEFPVPVRAFAAAVSLKHGRQNLARLPLALRPHRLKFWQFFPFIAFMTYLYKHLNMDSNLTHFSLFSGGQRTNLPTECFPMPMAKDEFDQIPGSKP